MKQQIGRVFLLCLCLLTALCACHTAPAPSASDDVSPLSSLLSDEPEPSDESLFSALDVTSAETSAPLSTSRASSTLPAAAAPTPATPQAERKTLTGTVTAFDAATVTVTDAAGRVFLFERNDTLLDPASDPFAVGARVIVTYTGGLVISKERQTVRVLSFFVQQKKTPEEFADEILGKMTLSEQVGQLFLARRPAKDTAATAARYAFGGYVLFARDFQGRSKAQVQAEIQADQKAVKIPMLLAVDEEGGTVVRVSSNPQLRATPFPSPQALFAAGGYDAVARDTAEKCALLRELGLNLNLAPVCDVSVDENDYIYPRSFGQDAAATARYIETVVRQMQTAKMGCALKHFPGYGNNVNTHTGISRDKRSRETLLQNDVVPFQSGISADAGIVMVSHNIVEAFDAQRPASLSPAVHDFLRRDLGYTGLILTDDLSMGAIKEYTGGSDPAVQAVLAGNDLLCCTDYEKQYPAVLAAAQSGTISRARLAESVRRILLYKINLGLLSQD